MKIMRNDVRGEGAVRGEDDEEEEERKRRNRGKRARGVKNR